MNVVSLIVFVFTVQVNATIVFILAHNTDFFLNLGLVATILLLLVFVANSD
jgi:hypothetical protein